MVGTRDLGVPPRIWRTTSELDFVLLLDSLSAQKFLRPLEFYDPLGWSRSAQEPALNPA